MCRMCEYGIYRDTADGDLVSSTGGIAHTAELVVSKRLSVPMLIVSGEDNTPIDAFAVKFCPFCGKELTQEKHGQRLVQ